MKKITENEIKYGTGLLTEKDVIIQCITNLTKIESVINVKGLELVHTYLSERLMKLGK